MIKLVNVKYKAIFDYKEHKDEVTYVGQGTYDRESELVSFDDQDAHIEVSIEETCVKLTTNENTLLLKKEITENTYSTPYGDVLLYTLLKSSKTTDTSMKVVYQLLQDDEVMCDVYLLINIQEVENHEENTQLLA